VNTVSQKLAADFLGTLALVLFGAGAICAEQFLRATSQAGAGPLGIALAYGLAYGALVATAGPFSGGYFNPAVTIGCWVTRRLDTFQAVGCVAAQLAGATAGAYLLRLAVPEDTWRAAALGTPALGNGVLRTPGMLIEGVLAFFAVFVVFATALKQPGQSRPTSSATATAGLGTALIVTAGALVGGPFTGGAMNPARAFGPALASRHWANHGVYWVGPLAGGVLAAWVYDALFAAKNSEGNGSGRTTGGT
jgi:MIP family channel proteins